MPGYQVVVDSKRVRRHLRKAIARAKNATPAWKVAGEILKTAVDDTFVAEGARGRGSKWQKLKTATINQRLGGSKAYTKKGKLRAKSKRRLAKFKILQRTGRLRRSYIPKAFMDGVLIGSALKYAAAHEFGNPDRNLPKRSVFDGIDDRDLEMIGDVLLKYVDTGEV